MKKAKPNRQAAYRAQGRQIAVVLRDKDITMSTAHDIIEAIAADLGLEASALTAEDRRRIRHGLEDGAALAYLGFGDADQDAIEEAHGMMQ